MHWSAFWNNPDQDILEWIASTTANPPPHLRAARSNLVAIPRPRATHELPVAVSEHFIDMDDMGIIMPPSMPSSARGSFIGESPHHGVPGAGTARSLAHGSEGTPAAFAGCEGAGAMPWPATYLKIIEPRTTSRWMRMSPAARSVPGRVRSSVSILVDTGAWYARESLGPAPRGRTKFLHRACAAEARSSPGRSLSRKPGHSSAPAWAAERPSPSGRPCATRRHRSWPSKRPTWRLVGISRQAFPDQTFSFVDCTILRGDGRAGITEAFAFDATLSRVSLRGGRHEAPLVPPPACLTADRRPCATGNRRPGDRRRALRAHVAGAWRVTPGARLAIESATLAPETRLAAPYDEPHRFDRVAAPPAGGVPRAGPDDGRWRGLRLDHLTVLRFPVAMRSHGSRASSPPTSTRSTRPSRLAAWCSPRGSARAVPAVHRSGRGYLIVCERWVAATLLGRLRMFVLRVRRADRRCR